MFFGYGLDSLLIDLGRATTIKGWDGEWEEETGEKVDREAEEPWRLVVGLTLPC
jgi:hypothetical protein